MMCAVQTLITVILTALESIMLCQYLHKMYLSVLYVNFLQLQLPRESPRISGSISQSILYAEKVK